MVKNSVIVVLAVAVLALGYLAWQLSKPLCDDLIGYQFNGELVCELSLGQMPEDSADVRIRSPR